MTCLNDVQKTLSQAQAIPLVGFMFVSPIKLMMGLAEMMTGVLGSLSFGLAGWVGHLLGRDHEAVDLYTYRALVHAELGLIAATYALGNMATLGVAGLVLEEPLQ